MLSISVIIAPMPLTDMLYLLIGYDNLVFTKVLRHAAV